MGNLYNFDILNHGVDREGQEIKWTDRVIEKGGEERDKGSQIKRDRSVKKKANDGMFFGREKEKIVF